MNAGLQRAAWLRIARTAPRPDSPQSEAEQESRLCILCRSVLHRTAYRGLRLLRLECRACGDFERRLGLKDQ